MTLIMRFTNIGMAILKARLNHLFTFLHVIQEYFVDSLPILFSDCISILLFGLA